MPWTQEPDGCIHPVDEWTLLEESPIFHQLMGERQIECEANSASKQ